MTSDRTRLVAATYKKNNRNSGFAALGKEPHSFEVDVGEYPVDADLLTFEADNYPYLRFALADTYVEDCEHSQKPD